MAEAENKAAAREEELTTTTTEQASTSTTSSTLTPWRKTHFRRSLWPRLLGRVRGVLQDGSASAEEILGAFALFIANPLVEVEEPTKLSARGDREAIALGTRLLDFTRTAGAPPLATLGMKGAGDAVPAATAPPAPKTKKKQPPARRGGVKEPTDAADVGGDQPPAKKARAPRKKAGAPPPDAEVVVVD